ncbi:MAG: AAA family ATPase, partial [Lentisphaeria bacterium]|nr:AAA family ATPase [Lentisphaeria bacterium]
MRTITISQLRRISDLTMELPSGNGVYLLTGANGAGKSTLLSVMAQIGDRGALAHFFQPNITFRDEENILSQSMIRYAADEQQFVEYRFRNDAWTVTEGDADAAFSAFGFAETLFAGARPKRQPKAGEVFDRTAHRPAPEPNSEAVASIFDDEDFRKLAVITSPATGKDVFLRPIELNG